jgi:predicted DCC family thiol-disulfide oxidoreductase YuxK
MPKFLSDAAYNAVARNRYRIFGRSEVCALPREEDRARFLDQQ